MHKALLPAQVQAEPDVTRAELREPLCRRRGISVAVRRLDGLTTPMSLYGAIHTFTPRQRPHYFTAAGRDPE